MLWRTVRKTPTACSVDRSYPPWKYSREAKRLRCDVFISIHRRYSCKTPCVLSLSNRQVSALNCSFSTVSASSHQAAKSCEARWCSLTSTTEIILPQLPDVSMQELDILSPAGTARMFIGLLGDQCKAKRPMEMRFYLYSTLKWRLRFSSDKRRNLSKKAGNSIVVSERHPHFWT